MITLACKNCGCSLDRETNVGLVDARSGDLGGTYDWCPESPTFDHVARKLVVVSVPVKVAVDPEAWQLAYGDVDDLPGDVRAYLLNAIQGLAPFDENGFRDVEVRGA